MSGIRTLLKGFVAHLGTGKQDAGPGKEAGALHEAGTNALRAGRLEEAADLLAQAISLDAGNATHHKQRGDALRQLWRLDEAVQCYREAARLRPDYADPHNNLGVVLEAMGRPAEAIDCYRAALARDPDFAEAHLNLGNALQNEGRFDAAVSSYREATRARPDFALAYNNLALLLRDLERFDEARECDERVMALAPNDGTRIKLASALPVVAGSNEEITRIRDALRRNITALIERGVSLDNPLAEVGKANFYLPYHGQNDKDLQCLFARMHEQACPALRYTAPHCAPGARMPPRRRVGFLSRHFFNHSVGTWYSRLIDRIAAGGAVDVAVITVGEVEERQLQSVFPSVVRHLSVPFDLAQARRRIADLKLDILVYADIGMDPLSYFLAFARLAPVQCTTLGHPVTSGVPNIDYFLSSALLEPEDARSHYSEELVLLESLPAYIARPALPAAPRTRAQLGLPEDRRLYVCPTMLHKLHPDFDGAIAGILRCDPAGEVILFRDSRFPQRHKLATDRFAATIPDVLGRVRFLPWLGPDDLMSLLMAADVALDTFHFGAATTTFLVLATGTPIVTLPAAFVRGRATLACYREIGVMDCVARTPGEYVDLAVRIATDKSLRDDIRSRIMRNVGVIYDDPRLVSQMTSALTKLEPLSRPRQ